MPGKRSIGLILCFYATTIASPLLGAQQPPDAAQQPPAPAPQVPPPQASPPVPRKVPVPPPPSSQVPNENAPQRPAAPERRLLPPPSASGSGMVSLNFNRADLVEIIHILAQHLRLTYTIDPEVKGTVTIHSAEPLRTEDLLPIFHQVLRMNGAVAVRTGNIYRITPIKEGKGLARPMGQSREDSFAIQVVPVRFFSVAEMKKLLTPFLMPGGEIIDYPRGNFLVIVDLPSNIQRLVEIADLIDVQVFAGTRMEIYQPKVASAEELAAEMTKIMQSFAASAAQPEGFAAQFIPLPRINQLLVISHSEAAWAYAKRWLERIDVVAEGPGRRIFIYPVENGKATELAEVLNQALGQPSTGRRDTPRTLQDLHRSSPGGSGQLGTRSPTPYLGGSSPTTQQTSPLGAFATVPAPGQPPPPAAPPAPPAPGAPPRPPTPAAPGAKPEEQLRIVADPATNSLIIYGTAQEFQNIKNILKELDIVPRQVLMDVLVTEVTLTDEFRFGVDYEILHKGGDVRIFNREFGSRGSILGGVLPPAAASGLTPFGLGVSGVIGTGNAVRAFINALMTDSRVKVLSHPTVLASDNRPARIQVGTEEPVPTGTVQSPVSGGTITSSTTVQYRNTGRILTIIPQVNSQGLVHLQIKAEVSQRGVNVTVGQDSFPSFDTRDAETTAVVQDGETLAIGGIIADRRERRRTGIPYLMDIPVLGRFFGTTRDNVDRTELIMLITPHVIRNKEESKDVTEDLKNKLSTIRNELEKMRRDREKEEEEREKARQKSKEKAEPQLQDTENPAVPAPTSNKPAPKPSVPAGQRAATGPVSNTPDRLEPLALPFSKNSESKQPDVSKPVAPSVGPETKAQQAKPIPPAVRKETAAALTPVTKEPTARSIPSAVETVREEKRPTQTWFVQVSSFAEPQAAEMFVKKLRDKGYDAYVAPAEVKGKNWHRVRVGRFADREAASEMEKRLKGTEKLEQAFTAVGG